MKQYWIVGLILVIVALLVVYREKLTALFAGSSAGAGGSTGVGTTGGGTTQPAGPALNQNLFLARGSSGPEVSELQRRLGVTADGQFGPITENALQNQKCVSGVTLAGYNIVNCPFDSNAYHSGGGSSNATINWFNNLFN